MKFRSSKVAVAAAMMLASSLAGCAGNIADAPDGGGGGGGKGGGGGGGGSGPCVPAGNANYDGGVDPTFANVKLVFSGGGAIQPCAAAPCHASGGMAPPPPELPL